MPLIAGNYDIETYQGSNLELFVSYVSELDKVQDYSEMLSGTAMRKYGFVMWVRPKRDPLPDNGTILDSINDFDLQSPPLIDWLGKESEVNTYGQIVFDINEVTDPTDLTEHTVKVRCDASVMRQLEGGTYYYDIDLVERSNNVGWTQYNSTTIKLLYGKFKVIPSMTREINVPAGYDD